MMPFIEHCPCKCFEIAMYLCGTGVYNFPAL